MSNTRWEYKVIPLTDIADKQVFQKIIEGLDHSVLECEPFEKWLNEMGQQGWELVESNPIHAMSGMMTTSSYLTYLVFKRVLA